MSRWLRRIRATIAMGVIWALGWGAVGGLIELLANIIPGFPPGRWVDMWIQTLAIPGFIGGVVFATVLQVAERQRRFGELSLPRFAAWGAVAGVLLGGLIVGLGLNPVIVAPITLLSAGSAAGSLALARMATDRDAIDAGMDTMELRESGRRKRLGGRE